MQANKYLFIKIAWLMAPKRKLNEISKHNEKSNGSFLSNLNKKISPKYENEEDRRCINFDNCNSDWYVWHYWTWNVRWVQMSFTMEDHFNKYVWIGQLKDKTTKKFTTYKVPTTLSFDNGKEFENKIYWANFNFREIFNKFLVPIITTNTCICWSVSRIDQIFLHYLRTIKKIILVWTINLWLSIAL